MKLAVFAAILAALGLVSSCSQASADNKADSKEPGMTKSATPVPANAAIDDGRDRRTVVVDTANANLPAATANRGSDIGPRGQRPDVRPNATPMPLQFKPAPENSQFAVTMDRDGMIREVRVFRSHPKLAKAEISYKTPDEKTVRITLRDGKTFEVRSNRIKALQAAKAAELLALAGQ